MRSLSSWTLGLRSRAGSGPLRQGLGWQAQNGQHLALTALNDTVYRGLILITGSEDYRFARPSGDPTPW